MSWKYNKEDIIIICITIIIIVFINVYFKKPPTTAELYNQALKQCDSMLKSTTQENICRENVTQFYKEMK